MTTHADLVAVAARWLRGRRCSPVLTEPGYVRESPDAIGWRTTSRYGRGSVLVECKTSRADFLRDAKKTSRAVPEFAEALMGAERWYLVPLGVRILPGEVEGCGLLILDVSAPRSKIVVDVPAPRRVQSAASLAAEVELMRLQLARHDGAHFRLAMASVRRIDDVGELRSVATLAREVETRIISRLTRAVTSNQARPA